MQIFMSSFSSSKQQVLYSYKSSKGGYVIEKITFRKYHLYVYVETPN